MQSPCRSFTAQCLKAYQVFSPHHWPTNHGKHSDDEEIKTEMRRDRHRQMERWPERRVCVSFEMNHCVQFSLKLVVSNVSLSHFLPNYVSRTWKKTPLRSISYVGLLVSSHVLLPPLHPHYLQQQHTQTLLTPTPHECFQSHYHNAMHQ